MVAVGSDSSAGVAAEDAGGRTVVYVERPMKVFVYGALLADGWSGRTGQCAALSDYAVRFVARGVPWLEPVFATLVPEAGSVAYGAVFEINEQEWRAACAHEDGYLAAEVQVAVDARLLTVHTLISLPDERLPEERAPSARYASLLCRGAVRCGLPPEVVDRYERLARTGSKATTYLRGLRAPVAALTPLVGFGPAVGIVLGCLLVFATLLVFGMVAMARG